MKFSANITKNENSRFLTSQKGIIWGNNNKGNIWDTQKIRTISNTKGIKLRKMPPKVSRKCAEKVVEDYHEETFKNFSSQNDSESLTHQMRAGEKPFAK